MQVQAFRDEVNHKFSVQVAENKRLQSQLQKHSADMSKVCIGWHVSHMLHTRRPMMPPPPSQLLRLMEGMNARVKQLESEVGLG